MQRAVITGIGIVSCLGNDQVAVTESLRTGRSGITRRESYAEIGMRSHVAAGPDVDLAEHIGRKQLRFMGAAAAYAYISMQQAIDDAGLELLVTDARHGFHHRGYIVGAEYRGQVADVDEPGDIVGLVNLGGPEFRIDVHRRRHRVAAGIAAAGANQGQQRAVGTGPVDAVHRVVGIVTGIII